MYNYEMYERREEATKNQKEMSLRAYNIAIGLILLWGFVINFIMCAFFQDTFMSWNPIAVIVGYFTSALIGIFMSNKSKNPYISFIGYSLIVLPVGVVLSIALSQYDGISILNAIIMTTIVTVVMVIIAGIIPNIFISMGSILFISLGVCILCEVILMLFGIEASWIDFVVAVIFCGYIGYDWSMAQKKEKTLDNAVDSVVGLYLDIVNLFIRILEITGNKD